MARKIITGTIFTIMGMLIVPTIYKIYQNHNANLIRVVENEFRYYAKNCYNENKCENIVYLKDLYDKNYLKEKLTNPLNKKYYDEKSFIDLATNEINLIS